MQEQGRTILYNGRQGLFYEVYFEPDTDVLIETSRPTLETVGRQMAANPTLRVLLRAYAAPFKTIPGRYFVSESRGEFCRDYLVQRYGIAANRISIESYGSTMKPEHVTNDWGSYRCVELITYQ